MVVCISDFSLSCQKMHQTDIIKPVTVHDIVLKAQCLGINSVQVEEAYKNFSIAELK
jgi:hypothetical protein